MSSMRPADIVLAFLGEWPKGLEQLKLSFEKWLSGDVQYENVGLTKTTTREAARTLIETFAPGLDNIDVQILAMAVDGDRVLNERVDYLRRGDGSVISTIRVMGIFVLRDGLIAEWRDYFDTAPFWEAPKSAPTEAEAAAISTSGNGYS